MPPLEPPAHYFALEQPFQFEGGEVLPSLKIAYETWGNAADCERVVLILHALSGSSHAFSSMHDPANGWWQSVWTEDSALRAPGTFVVAANLLGSCYGTTGPSTLRPQSTAAEPSTPYALEFPQLTTGDMIEAYRELLRGIALDRPVTLMGGSLGGMLALEWAVKHPSEVENVIALVSPPRSTAQAIALRSVQRQAIQNDLAWNDGNYYGGAFPKAGLSLARQIGVITYRSPEELERRFGREERDSRRHFTEGLFQVQSYLRHHGEKFVGRFDPNTYLYLSRAMDLFDLAKGYASFADAMRRIQARLLLLAVSSDILVPPEQMQEIHRVAQGIGLDSCFEILRSPLGHDAFLLEGEAIRGHIGNFLRAGRTRSTGP